MSDLISRSALLRKTETMHDGMKCCLAVNEKHIYTALAVDAVPVVHGYWDDSGRYRFPSGKKAIRCNMCGCALSEGEYNLFNWNYCPVCGAKMDGENDGE